MICQENGYPILHRIPVFLLLFKLTGGNLVQYPVLMRFDRKKNEQYKKDRAGKPPQKLYLRIG